MTPENLTSTMDFASIELEGEPRSRVTIESVSPSVDQGRFPVKRSLGEIVQATADVFTDGHDAVSAVVRYRHSDDEAWAEVRMQPSVNDRWHAEFSVDRLGTHVFTIQAWIDRFQTWRRDFQKRVMAQQDLHVALMSGAELIEAACARAEGHDGQELRLWCQRLRGEVDGETIERITSDELLGQLMHRYDERPFAVQSASLLSVSVDTERGRYSTWYEVFPRSCAPRPEQHGTLLDLEAKLNEIAAMGFDVLYLPPIHPIGRTFRKGKNNTPTAEPHDVGSPWAIGAEEGGHKAIHPELGTLDDFQRLVASARDRGIDIALDIAFQCSPDHPYVRSHPEWFRHRADGTIQYAENPPKKYEDIYPFDFECEAWAELWQELKSVFTYWCEQGVRVFRVDNPHTKPFNFWHWLIAEVKRAYPETIFLSEAFTRPRIMYRLAKIGFTQSYTYFAWRTTKHELTEYLSELAQGPVAEFFRPNLWPNTPDILTEQLQMGGRAVFASRLVLAACLGASYGIYGPAFELCESEARAPGSEEYKDSEKYQLRHGDVNFENSLRDFIARVNQIRRENRALQANRSLRFHDVDNDQLLCFSKHTSDFANIIVVVVNLDPHYTQSGFVHIPLDCFELDESHPYQMHDALGGGRYLWHGPRNFVQLNPQEGPAHIFRLRRHIRSERDFEYFL